MHGVRITEHLSSKKEHVLATALVYNRFADADYI
jgi:hypothetical protein